MAKKISMFLAMIIALMMLVLISAPSFAEEYETIDDDDWGSVTKETLEENAPEMTREFVQKEKAEQETESKPEPKEEPKPVKEEPVHAKEPQEAEPVKEEPDHTEEPEEENVAEAPQTTEAEPEATESEQEEPVTAEPETEEAEIASEELNTEEPQGEAREEQNKEETDEPEAKEEPEEAEEESDVSISITTVMSGKNEMNLIAMVDDPENRKFSYQWQVSDDGGETFSDIENETGAMLSISLNEETIHEQWRVMLKEKQ